MARTQRLAVAPGNAPLAGSSAGRGVRWRTGGRAPPKSLVLNAARPSRRSTRREEAPGRCARRRASPRRARRGGGSTPPPPRTRSAACRHPRRVRRRASPQEGDVGEAEGGGVVAAGARDRCPGRAAAADGAHQRLGRAADRAGLSRAPTSSTCSAKRSSTAAQPGHCAPAAARAPRPLLPMPRASRRRRQQWCVARTRRQLGGASAVERLERGGACAEGYGRTNTVL